MNIFSLKKSIGRGAAYELSRVAFFTCQCALLLIAASCTQDQKSPIETKRLAAGRPSVSQIDDAKIKELLKPGGKPLLVNFWATWCGPCREEFPDLVKIDQEYKGKVDFFTVSLDFVEELETGVPEFLREMNAEMPTYLLVSADENKLISSISKEWTGALPFTLLYSETGEIVYSRHGKVNPEKLESEIEKALGGKN